MKKSQKRDILLKAIKYHEEYLNLFKEVQAREAGEEYAKKFKDEIRGVSGSNRGFFEISGKRTLGTINRYSFRRFSERGRDGENDNSAKSFEEEITDNDGRKVKIDINPINSETSVTINNKLEQMNAFYQSEANSFIDIDNDINSRTDKTKFLTNNEVKQLEKDKENFETYTNKLIKNELSPLTQLRIVEKLPSAYNNIPNLKGKKVVISQEVYKKIIDLPNKFNKNHYIDRTRAQRLPQLISDPLYILKSVSDGNEHRFVIVTGSINNKTRKNNKQAERLSIVLEPKNNAIVVSAYDEHIDISKEKKASRVLYDKKKELSKTLAASKTVTIDNSNNSITYKEDNFNPDGKTYYQESGPYEAIINNAKQYASKKVLEENSKAEVKESELTEEQKKYRDTAYNIIWYALSHSKNEKIKHLFKDIKQIKMLLGNTKQTSKNKGNTTMREKLEFGCG